MKRLLLLLLLTGCTTPTVVSEDAVALQYDVILESRENLDRRAAELCASFGRKAVFQSDHFMHTSMRVITYKCEG